MKPTLKGFVARTKNKETPQKDKIRRETVKFICQELMSRGVNEFSFLTLPSAWWRFEINMSQEMFRVAREVDANCELPYIRFVGCEREWALFQLGCAYMPTYKHSVLKVKRHDELNCQVVTNSYDYLFFNCDIFEYIRVIKDRKKEGDRKFDCIWLDTTTSVSHIGEKLTYLENVIKDGTIVVLTVIKGREHKKLPAPREEYISGLLKPIGLELINCFEYNDTTPMLHLIYKFKRK